MSGDAPLSCHYDDASLLQRPLLNWRPELRSRPLSCEDASEETTGDIHNRLEELTKRCRLTSKKSKSPKPQAPFARTWSLLDQESLLRNEEGEVWLRLQR